MSTRVLYMFTVVLLCVGMNARAETDCWTWKQMPLTQVPDWSTIDILDSFFTFDKNEQKLALLAHRWDHYIELWYLDGDKFVRDSVFKYSSPYDPSGFYYDETLSSLVIITEDNCGFECIQAVAYCYWKGTKQWTKIAESDAISPIAPNLAYDSIRKKAVIVGLFHPYSDPYYAFLEFDGFRFATIASIPDFYIAGPIGFDPNQRKVILWGCAKLRGMETCIYDGNNWRTIATPHAPEISSIGDFQRTVFVPQLGAISFLHVNSSIFEVWQFVEQDWKKEAFKATPPPRKDALIGYEESSGKLIFGGGWNVSGIVSDFWEMVPASHCRPLTKP